MNFLIRVLSSVLLGLGIWLCTSERRALRAKNAAETVKNFGSRKEKPGITDAVVGSLSDLLAERVKLSPERKAELEHDLRTAHLAMTPEAYVGQNLAVTALVLLLSMMIGTAVWPGFYLIGAVCAVLVYRKQQDRTVAEKKKIEAAIDGCMPEFASFVCSYVRVDHDVMQMLSRYRQRCGEPILKEELDMTISDAASSGMESALIRLDARARSPQLSSIVRALITLANGTYRVEHFEQLEAQFEQKEKERLSRAASDAPAKLKPYNFAIYAAFALLLMTLFVTLFVRYAGELL